MVLILASVWALAGCSLVEGNGAASQPGGAVQAHGQIVMIGGPAPGAPRPIGGARIRFTGPAGSVTTRADDHGRFSFSARPGRYSVRLVGHAPMVNGAFFDTNPRTIVVRPGGKPLKLAVDLP